MCDDARTMRRWLVLALFVTAGCGRTVTDEDCKKIGDNMHSVWLTEAQKVAPDGPGAEKATAVIRSEGDKLQADWTAQCKKELMGRRVDPKEIDCLLSATTIDEMNRCSEL